MNLHLLSVAEALKQANSRPSGLTSPEAAGRLTRYGPNLRKQVTRTSPLRPFLNQVRSPLVILLIAAMSLSFALGDHADALIVMAIVLVSSVLGFWQEYRASNAVAALLAVVETRVNVLRDGSEVEVPVSEVVPGDIVILNAGDTIPGDGLLLESKDLFVDESALTGENYPSEKKVGAVSADARQSERTNAVFEGTHVVSGNARALMISTGTQTEFGGISERLRLRAPETEFERGMRRFGEMLIRVTLLLVMAIFAINVFFNRPALEAFMFALALAVGMTPELLPAIVTITLARGAKLMARQHVIVRRLAAIENFGSMDVLCSDKTGTLTEGRMQMHSIVDADGNPSDTMRLHAVLNAVFETSFSDPIDEALRTLSHEGIAGFTKFDEVPYDFIRKRLSVVVEHRDGIQQHLMITKGAFRHVLDVCTHAVIHGQTVPVQGARAALDERFERYSNEGHRVLGLAFRDVTGDPVINKDDEQEMTFSGFLLFDDPAKEGAAQAVQELAGLGVSLKLITGDNSIVAASLGARVGLTGTRLLTGKQLAAMNDAALIQQVDQIDIFAETEPNQKERTLMALRKAGHVVGYLGDGINDASALHAADVSISVDSAVDVAKEAADIVLLQHDLGVLAQGVRNGRSTFANTLKYIFITTSANFGNMFSMAGASFFLPFLPLLPKQILLNNLLSDLPAIAIATDTVDPEDTQRPRRWNQPFIQRFMMTFGLLSSMFDFLAFTMLLLVLRAGEAQFQTGWFVESLLTEVFIVMVIRTRRPCFQSRPGKLLFVMALLVGGIAIGVPYTALGKLFGFVPLPPAFIGILVIVTLLYLWVSEITKRILLNRMEMKPARLRPA